LNVISSAVAAARSPEAVVADFERRAARYETPCGDGTMVWRTWGSGPPLVLLHGSHGSWAHWIRNVDDLASFRQIWVPDLPGCGESTPPPRLDDGAHVAELLPPVLDELLGSRFPIDVVGFSMGAWWEAISRRWHRKSAPAYPGRCGWP